MLGLPGSGRRLKGMCCETCLGQHIKVWRTEPGAQRRVVALQLVRLERHACRAASALCAPRARVDHERRVLGPRTGPHGCPGHSPGRCRALRGCRSSVSTCDVWLMRLGRAARVPPPLGAGRMSVMELRATCRRAMIGKQRVADPRREATQERPHGTYSGGSPVCDARTSLELCTSTVQDDSCCRFVAASPFAHVQP